MSENVNWVSLPRKMGCSVSYAADLGTTLIQTHPRANLVPRTETAPLMSSIPSGVTGIERLAPDMFSNAFLEKPATSSAGKTI